MTTYSMIVLGLFVLMWVLCNFEISRRNKTIKKQANELDELTEDYNQIASDYNDVCDFLEKHFTPEQLEELFIQHDVDRLAGDDPAVRTSVERQLRENHKPR